ncbi:MAG: hypothetical protein IJO80_04585 [Firmicutes bacterium]|nr:hypothetical protein [Bacillota bacterium]
MSKFYHAAGKRRGYFEGWYCKCVAADGRALALIPALHIDEQGRRSASLQLITAECSWWLPYPAADFAAAEQRFCVQLGDCRFADDGLQLHIDTPQLQLRGRLFFAPLTRLKRDIMGPFRLLADMECAHGVLSMGHGISGQLWLNGELWDFGGGYGYIETDRGHSFPQKYLWTQAHHAGGGLMLAIAAIPRPLRFTGIICAVTDGGREYRLASYRGASCLGWDAGGALVRQGRYLLQAQLLQEQARPLKAPVGGSMQRIIHESLCATVEYRLWRGDKLLLHFTDAQAGFEYAANGGRG